MLKIVENLFEIRARPRTPPGEFTELPEMPYMVGTACCVVCILFHLVQAQPGCCLFIVLLLVLLMSQTRDTKVNP